MTISALQNWTRASATSTSVSKAYVSVPTAGNLLVACIDVDTNLISTVTDNIGDSVAWTQIAGSPYMGVAFTIQTSIWYKIVGTPSGGLKTVTATPNASGFVELYIVEYQGNATSSPVDGTPTGVVKDSAAINPDPGAITTAGGGVVIGFVASGVNLPTAATNWTTQASASADVVTAVEDRFTSSSGTYNPNWTASSQRWIAMGVAFKVLPTGPAIPVLMNTYRQRMS